MNYSPCPTCGGEELYWSQSVSTGDYPNVEPARLGGIAISGTFRLLMCAGCGLTRFYADEASTKKLAGSFRWRRHTPDDEK